MLLNLINWLIEHFQGVNLSCDEHAENKATNQAECGTLVMKLDHIRSQKVYCKTLEQWYHDLQLLAQLFICKKWIFLLVTGEKAALQVSSCAVLLVIMVLSAIVSWLITKIVTVKAGQSFDTSCIGRYCSPLELVVVVVTHYDPLTHKVC